MAGKIIGLIYFYVISAVAIGLLIFAAFSWANFILNLTQFEQYPLRYGIENCDFRYPQPVKMGYVGDSPETASMSSEERDRTVENCKQQTEFDRKQHEVDDIKNSVVATLVGVILFLIHFPQAKKMSKQS